MGSLFVMIAKDGPDGARLRKEVRSEHLAHLDALVKAGKIAIAGPFTDGTGSLIVFEADSIEAAQAQAASDPYVTRGVFESFEVKPFKRVLP